LFDLATVGNFWCFYTHHCADVVEIKLRYKRRYISVTLHGMTS